MPKYATAKTAIPVEELSQLIDYDPHLGTLKWKVIRKGYGGGVWPGKDAGCPDKYGYILVAINGLYYPAHRIAWYLHYRCWPEKQIDHIDMDFLNNRISNLREATMTQQRANQRVRKDSIVGVKGVQRTRKGRWKARIRGLHLGIFDTVDEASDAYWKAAQEHFGEFARRA